MKTILEIKNISSKIERQKYIKEIKKRKMIKNIKVRNFKQLVKRILLNFNIECYLKIQN